jgi:predicted dehydrogenase
MKLKNRSPATSTPTQKLRLGVVGGGDIGIRNGESASRASSVHVAAVYDANPDVCRLMAQRFSVKPAGGYDELLMRDDIDAVLLSVPHYLHSPLGVAAARAGKHVMVEKPLGVDLSAATVLLDACHTHNVRLTVNFSFRFKPTIQLALRLINDGVLGSVAGIQVVHLIHKSAGYWAGGYTGRSPSDWRSSLQKAGGGILIMGISHTIDYLRYLTGIDVKRAFAEYGTFSSPAEVEDAITVSMQYSNGAIGSILASTCWRGRPMREDRIWGSDGVLLLNSDSVEFWSARRWQDRSAGKPHVFRKFPEVDYTREWIERFALAILTGVPHDISGEDGWINNAIMEAIYQSRKTGQAMGVASLLQDPKRQANSDGGATAHSAERT